MRAITDKITANLYGDYKAQVTMTNNAFGGAETSFD